MDASSDELERLIARWREGDSLAYRAFLEAASARRRAFMASRLGDASQAEDLVQECLIAMHEKRATLDRGRPVAPWMFAIARYKLVDHWRGRALAPVHMREVADPRADPHAEAARLDVESLLGRLPGAKAEAIRMTKLEGMTGREASRPAGVGSRRSS